MTCQELTFDSCLGAGCGASSSGRGCAREQESVSRSTNATQLLPCAVGPISSGSRNTNN